MDYSIYVVRTKPATLRNVRRTLYLFFRSDERAALIRIRRSLEGALKCAFRDLRLELLTPAQLAEEHIRDHW
jgi:hypothetical protein